MNLLHKRIFVAILMLLVAGYTLFNLPSQKIDDEKVYQVYALKFSDLSESERQKYISKSDLFEYGGYITPRSYTDSFDTNFDLNLSDNIDELKAKISELLAKNKTLIKDNVDIGEKNLELISKVDEIRIKTQESIENIKAKNNENLKAMEDRHTQNIKELTERINELQLQSVDSVKSYEKKMAGLENENLSLKTAWDKNTSEILKQKELEISKLIMQNESLKKELDNKNKDTNHGTNDINQIKKQIKVITGELELSKNELESLNAMHKKELKRIQSGFDMQRSVLEDELSKKTNLIIDLKTELESSKSSAKKVSMDIRELSNEKQKLNDKITELNSQNMALKDQNAKQDDKILSINKSVKELKDNLEAKKIEIKTLNEKNSELNATINLKLKDIKALNLMTNDMNQSIKNLSDELNLKQNIIKNLEANATELSNQLKFKNIELETQKVSAKTDMRNYEILKDQIDNLKLLADKNQATKKLQDEINTLKLELSKKSTQAHTNSELSSRLSELEKELELGLDKQDKLEDENKNLKMILENQTKPEVPKKVVFVSQVECRDMSNSLKVSLNCKNRVSEFLNRYNSNYMYEVIPIIDTRGYSLPYEIASRLKKDEISRLNSYVDFGVGRDRANVAAGLIKDEFGEFSRIIFSSVVVKRENARGFIIKAYR